MSTLKDKLIIIQQARDAIRTALAEKGQVVGKDIRDYAQAVSEITTSEDLDEVLTAQEQKLQALEEALNNKGTVPATSGVKLFETIEEMQSDENAHEGDLAVVYRKEIQPVTEESEFDSCIFPNEVVLDEAFTDNVFGSFRSTGGGFFDGMVDMSSSNFRFNGWGESSNINVQYTSQDGITYIRTDGGEELQEFGTTIQWDNGMGSFNSVVGNFMKIGGNYFEGIYKCNEVINYGKVKPIIITDKNTISDDVDYFNIDTIKSVFDDNLENFIENCSYLTSRIKSSSAYQTYGYKAIYYYWRYFVWVLNNDNTADLYCYFENTDGYISPFVYYNDTTYLGASTNNISGTSSITLKITINLVNETMTWEDMATTVNQYKTSGNHGVLIPFSFENKKIVAYYLRPYNSNWNYTSISYNTYNATSNYISTGFTQNLTTITSHSLDYKLELIYEYAKSQLDTTSDYVYEKTFYGKNGVETGRLQDITDLTQAQFVQRVKIYNRYKNLSMLSSVNSIYYAFWGNKDIIEVPYFDTSNVTSFSGAFGACTNLTTVPILNTSGASSLYQMFYNCTNLTNESLNNILQMCVSAVGANTKTLRDVGLTQEQATICTTLSNYQAFTNAGWTTGY